MEPLITVFSILFLAMTIKIYYEGFKLTNNITVLILLILSHKITEYYFNTL